MSGWHRDNPELVGTDADPWMQNPIHRRIVQGLDDVDRNRLHDERSGEEQDRCAACGGTGTILSLRGYGECVTAMGGPQRTPCPACSGEQDQEDGTQP